MWAYGRSLLLMLWTVALLLAAGSGLAQTAPAPASPAQPPVIRWLLLDFVPYHLIDGSNKGQGCLLYTSPSPRD